MRTSDDFILTCAELYLRGANRRLVGNYRRHHHRWPTLACPQRFSERMLWRKTVDRNPDFVTFSDKLAAKDFVRRICPDLPLPQTLWVGSDVAEIPEQLLRRDVFVKASHGSSFNYRTGGQPVDSSALAKLAAQWLATTYGLGSGEWPYQKVPRRIFVEESVCQTGVELLEFAIRAANGRPLLGSVVGHAKTPRQWRFYVDPEGRATSGFDDSPGAPVTPLPPHLDIVEPYRRAVEFARRLSRGTDYARYDFLWNGRELFGGEITLFPAGGNNDPTHPHVKRILDEGWDLRRAHFLKTPQRGWKKIYAGALRRRLGARLS